MAGNDHEHMDKDTHEDATEDMLYRQLLTMNRQMFSAGYYTTAYQALVAALCHADNGEDFVGLGEVAAVAREQLRWMTASPTPRPARRTKIGERHRLWEALAQEADRRRLFLLTSEDGLTSEDTLLAQL